MKLRFLNIAVLFTILCASITAQQSDRSLANFRTYEVAQVGIAEIFDVCQSSNEEILDLSLFGYDVQLYASPIYAPDYKVVDGEGTMLTDNRRPLTYRGSTSKGGSVALTISASFIYGFVREGDATLFFEPLGFYDETAESDAIVTYWVSDVI